MKVDDREFKKRVAELTRKIDTNVKKTNYEVGKEILRLSQFQVPHDDGLLQNSGMCAPETPSDEIIVGYNKTYAAYQHEGQRKDGSRKISRWQKGRKGKYLEDPIQQNKGFFRSLYLRIL